MKDTDRYSIVPLHQRPDLVKQCCKLLNSEWPRSETARLRTLKVSCDDFPTCLILVEGENRVLGHCKLTMMSIFKNSCFIESFIIDYTRRSQGLGSMLLCGAEEYAKSKGIQKIYLTTKGQELFYQKNGYTECEPIDLYGFTDFLVPPPVVLRARRVLKGGNADSGPPPPPPMPIRKKALPLELISLKTHMVKELVPSITSAS